jgi:putative oxidoreductase
MRATTKTTTTKTTLTRLLRTPGSAMPRRRIPVGPEGAGCTGPHADRPHARTTGPVFVAARLRALDHAVSGVLRPFTLPALRVLLGLVFVWFGALKVVGRSPVAGLVARTLPFANPHLVMLVLGTLEGLLGVMLIFGVFLRLALPVLVVHLAGTFATFVVAPHLMFSAGDPLLLTGNGEFVAKNVVLIAATLVLIAHTIGTPAKAQPASEAAPTLAAPQA